MIQGFFLEEALGEQIGLTDEEWALTGRCCRLSAGAGVDRHKTTGSISRA
ncbi:hypothetical protein X737_39750 [Mesorhizobium sp. L48C026A00]|nr:hypothetical protein X737_39750 [Mesorhizobium sp. L48C026A00]